MRSHFDERKSKRLRSNPKRGIGFEEAQEVFLHPTILTSARICPNSTARSDGWASACTQLFSNLGEDEEGEYYHLVTLWQATKQERQLYDEHS